jgi:hypothetical protein
MAARDELATALAVYLDDGEGDDPQERSDRRSALGGFGEPTSETSRRAYCP